MNNFLILVTYKFNPPQDSGGKILNYEFCNYLNKIIPTFVISTEDNESTLDFSLLPILPNRSRRYLPFNFTKKILRIIDEKKIDRLVSIQPYMGPSAIWSCIKSKIPFILLSHNIESQRFRSIGKWWWPFLYLYEMFVMQFASHIFFVSNQDKNWAVKNYFLNSDCCHYLPFGTKYDSKPELKSVSKDQIALKYGLDGTKEWVYFIGSMRYTPNYQAVININEYIASRLKKVNSNLQIIIIGGGLSSNIQEMLEKNSPFIKYLGFIKDIEEIIYHCKAMLNPTLVGGGIKTKAIEALAFNKQLIGFENATFGIEPEFTGNMMITVKDGDWDSLYQKLLENINIIKSTPQEFYNQYYWGNIVHKFLKILK